MTTRRLWLWFKLIGASGLFSSIVLFLLNYLLVERTKLEQIQVEIRKAVAETTQTELANGLRNIEAKYADRMQQLSVQQQEAKNRITDVEADYADRMQRLSVQQHETSNEVNLLEADIKENEREIAEVTARFKLAREKSATLNEESEAVTGAAQLFTNLAPNPTFSDHSDTIVESEEGIMVFGKRVSFKNDGKFGMNGKITIFIVREHDGRKITQFSWVGNPEFDVSPGGQINSYFKIKMRPDFSSMLDTKKRVFTVSVSYVLRTDEEARRFVTKRISPYFSKDSIETKSQTTATLSFDVICWKGESDRSSNRFTCRAA